MKFQLKITPKISAETRHQLQDILKANGYKVIAGGQTVGIPIDESFSDISFEKRNDQTKP